METVRTAGPEACRAGQAERREILEFLLANCNDGRRKTLFYLAANLLTLESLREIRREADAMADLALKERGTRTAALLQASAEREGVFLKLQKKPADDRRMERSTRPSRLYNAKPDGGCIKRKFSLTRFPAGTAGPRFHNPPAGPPAGAFRRD